MRPSPPICRRAPNLDSTRRHFIALLTFCTQGEGSAVPLAVQFGEKIAEGKGEAGQHVAPLQGLRDVEQGRSFGGFEDARRPHPRIDFPDEADSSFEVFATLAGHLGVVLLGLRTSTARSGAKSATGPVGHRRPGMRSQETKATSGPRTRPGNSASSRRRR